MIILKKHFKNKNTVIYGNTVSNGCQTFNINQLDDICKKFEVPEEIKQEVLKAHQENLKVDDMKANILERLQLENNTTINHAVVFGTKNHDLLKEMMTHFEDDENIKIVIANRVELSDELIKQLAQDKSDDVRLAIAKRNDLDESVIQILADDENYDVRAQIARRQNLNSAILQQLAKDKYRLSKF